MQQRKTLATISRQLRDLVSTMGSAPIVYYAPFDNKVPFDLVSEAIHDITESHNRVLGYIRVRNLGDGVMKLGVVVYPDEATQRKDEIKGVNYDRVCF